MKVFITGGTGFIGSHIVVELLSRGDVVTILARNPSKIPAFLEVSGVRLVQGGLDDSSLIREALAGQDACIHNALIWPKEPAELELHDTRAAVNVFRAAAEAGVNQLIYTSSTAVHRPFSPVMDESTRVQANDFYGATKAAAEAFLSAFSHQTGMRCNVIRPGPTIGPPVIPRAPAVCDRRFAEIIHAARKGDEIRVGEGDGRQFIGAPDLAKLYAAVLYSDVSGETYIGLSQNFTSWESIAQAVVTLTGSTSRLVAESGQFVPFRFNVAKIERDFGLTFDSTPAMDAHLRHLVAAALEG